MSNAYHSLATSDFSQNWSGSGLFTADDNWANVPSINGYRGDGLASATNVDPRTLTAASTSGGTIDVNFNQTAPNTFTTGGVTRFSGANVGNDTVVALAGSGTARAPSLVFYLDATGRSNITFSARLRDLESSADNAIQQVALQYRVSPTADWQNVSYVADATSGPSLAGSDITLTGTLGSDANGQSQVEVRVLTTDAAGSDEWVGIDDISITSVPVGNSATLAVNDVSIVEGDAGTSLLTFTVTRSNDTTAFSVNYGTGDGTASVGSDYVAATGTLSFAAGDGALSQQVSITINGDTDVEANETLLLNLTNIVGTTGTTTFSDAAATGTITNDDVSATAGISIGDVSITEGDSGTQLLTFTVTRDNNNGDFTLDYATSDGTATAGSDYLAANGSLSFTAGGALTQTFNVTINGDTAVETAETLTVTLSNLATTSGSATLTDATATGTITNDDTGAVAARIHDVQGAYFFSPLVAAEGITSFNTATAATVTITAIVTAIDTFGSVQGFYITEPTAEWDANNFTSEGIFVRTTSAVSGLTVGESVSVTANVMEYQDFTNLPRTMLVNATILQNNDTNTLPTFVIDGTAGHKIPTDIISTGTYFYFLDVI